MSIKDSPFHLWTILWFLLCRNRFTIIFVSLGLGLKVTPAVSTDSRALKYKGKDTKRLFLNDLDSCIFDSKLRSIIQNYEQKFYKVDFPKTALHFMKEKEWLFLLDESNSIKKVLIYWFCGWYESHHGFTIWIDRKALKLYVNASLSWEICFNASKNI